MTYTSINLVAIASMEWMQDNGFDTKSILHQAEVSGNNIQSWITSLFSAGMSFSDYVKHIAKLLGL